MTAGQMSAVYAIVGVADHGWGSVHTLGFGALSVVLLAGFVARQAGPATPLLPLRVFRLHLLCGANLVQALMVAGLFGFLFLGTPYVRRVLGDDAMATGLAFLPIALTTGAVMSALTALAMSVASPDDARLASGLFNTIQQVGGALGLAILATLATSRTEGLLADGQSTASALIGGYHLAFAEIDGQEAKRRGVSVRGIEQVQFAPANAKRLAELDPQFAPPDPPSLRSPLRSRYATVLS